MRTKTKLKLKFYGQNEIKTKTKFTVERFRTKINGGYPISTSSASTGLRQDTIQAQLGRYVTQAADISSSEAFHCWQEKRVTYDHLSPIAEDLISAPASQAYVERIFSICGMLTSGHRNRMERSLELRVFLKLNKALLNSD
jgi:hypothetical protein